MPYSMGTRLIFDHGYSLVHGVTDTKAHSLGKITKR